MGSRPSTQTSVSDQELAARFQQGDRRALDTLLDRYRRFARAKGRGYFLVGGDSDDIEQEALIGLYKAARDFRPERNASFRVFADLCITRQVITAIKTATRQKHQPLNQYVSMSVTRAAEDGAERSLEESLPGPADADPLNRLIAAEGVAAMRSSMAGRLSDLEVQVLTLYVDGRSYQEIGDQLGRHTKAIDNALQRIKRKLDEHLADERAAQFAELAVA